MTRAFPSATTALALAAIFITPFPAFAQSVATASTLDLSAIVQPLLAVIGTVISGLLAIYVPKGLAAFQARTGIQLTDQQRAVVLGAVRTAAGVVETKLDQGVMLAGHVEIANPMVRAEAVAAINAVPVAAAALNMTVDGVARMIVGAVDTAAHGAEAQTLIVQSPAAQSPAAHSPAAQSPAAQSPAAQSSVPQGPVPRCALPQAAVRQPSTPQTQAPQTLAPQTLAPQTLAPESPALQSAAIATVAS
jgi:hypothetical protein